MLETRATGSIEDARDQLVYEASPAIYMWWSSLSEFMESKEMALKGATEQAERSIWGVIIMMVIMLLVALAVGGAIAAVITRQLLNELGAEPADVKSIAVSVGRGELVVEKKFSLAKPGSIMHSLVEMANQLSETVKHVRSSADAVADTSDEILAGNFEISERTGEQAEAITETAAAMEEFGSTVKQNTENASEADKLAAVASDIAVQGGEMMTQVVDTMREIDTRSKEIAAIIGVIDSIAFQTNILALNASVEAARAGEQGRGFAVVADAVRTLAQRSADAAKEIRDLISQNVSRVEKGTAQVEEAGRIISEVVEAISKVSVIMTDISNASHEQSAGVDGIGKAIEQMDCATQNNAALVSQNADSAQHLKQQASDLQSAMSAFHVD